MVEYSTVLVFISMGFESAFSVNITLDFQELY